MAFRHNHKSWTLKEATEIFQLPRRLSWITGGQCSRVPMGATNVTMMHALVDPIETNSTTHWPMFSREGRPAQGGQPGGDARGNPSLLGCSKSPATFSLFKAASSTTCLKDREKTPPQSPSLTPRVFALLTDGLLMCWVPHLPSGTPLDCAMTTSSPRPRGRPSVRLGMLPGIATPGS